MASSLLALLDDIATVLDDVALMTKVAAKKTAGVLGDDLALNANQVSGVEPNREIPVVWSVAKGSFINKVILVPLVLALSYFGQVTGQTWIIPLLLMIGGAYLCFEGFEKLAHRFLHKKDEDDKEHEALLNAVLDEDVDMVQFEKDKIKGAVRTDFVLSAEIIVIALGSAVASGADFTQQVKVVTLIALIMTVGVYGIVAGIVKLDDLGLYLSKKRLGLTRVIGQFLVDFTPYLMKTLSVVGTAAMFMVGGHIIVSQIPALHHLDMALLDLLPEGLFKSLMGSATGGLWGIVFGAVVLVGVKLLQKVMGLVKK